MLEKLTFDERVIFLEEWGSCWFCPSPSSLPSWRGLSDVDPNSWERLRLPRTHYSNRARLPHRSGSRVLSGKAGRTYEYTAYAEYRIQQSTQQYGAPPAVESSNVSTQRMKNKGV